MPAARRREWGCQIGVEGQDLAARGVGVAMAAALVAMAETEGAVFHERYCGDRMSKEIRGRN